MLSCSSLVFSYDQLSRSLVVAHDSCQETFKETILFLPFLQQLNDEHSKTLNDVKMDNTGTITQFPELHHEVYGT